jgi:hypothetical protein
VGVAGLLPIRTGWRVVGNCSYLYPARDGSWLVQGLCHLL